MNFVLFEFLQNSFTIIKCKATSIFMKTNLKYGWLGDIVICSTSLVMSSSEKASFRLSDCRITFENNHRYST